MTENTSSAESKPVSLTYHDIGFEPCKFEPDACDKCGNVRPLFFGDSDYWDCREGSHICAECLDKRIAEHPLVYCHACSLAGGADMPIHHEAPACPLTEEETSQLKKKE